jgi:pimeloyl-ACP methyl ester carboxylesterase
MTISPFYPYRSAKAREEYLSSYDRSAEAWPVASESRMVPTSFGQTFIRISGPRTAPPLVLLPGLNATSLLWEPNICALSASYRTFALDRHGDLGRSVCTRPISDVAALRRWLDETLTALALAHPIHLVGLSYGGWLAMDYALNFPQRIRKLVLLAPGGVLPVNLQFFLRAIPVLTGRRRYIRWFVHWLLEDVRRKDPSRVERSVEWTLLNYRCYRPQRLVGAKVFKDRELAALRTPALFLVGENEIIYPAVKAVRRLNRVAPQIRTEIIPGAGHDLTLSQPDLVNRRILDFLAEPSA